MSTNLSARAIATTLAAICASGTIACGAAPTAAKSPAGHVAAREVAPERTPVAATEAEPAPPAEPEAAAPPAPPATDAAASSAGLEGQDRGSVATAAAPAAEAPKTPAKRPQAKKKVAAQGGCGAGTCG